MRKTRVKILREYLRKQNPYGFTKNTWRKFKRAWIERNHHETRRANNQAAGDS
jgi:hypothetical protein